MTLYKQLSTFVFTVFLLVVAGLSTGQLNETRGFLYQQMQSELDNSSQALSLMLQPSMEQADKVAAETLITAMFDGGLYQSITLKWLADGSQQTWVNNRTDAYIPAWFYRLPLFEEQAKTTTIVSGWLQLGEIEIVSHPGYGYRQIWQSFVTSLFITALMLVLMLTVVKWWLRQLLKPLQHVQQRAENVAQKQFSTPMAEPKTIELALLVRSINTMEAQLKLQFEAHKEHVNTLQKSLLTDAVSGLPNRSYMIGRLKSWLHEPADGCVVMVQLPLLEQVREQFGYQLRDELIGRLGQQLQALPQNVISSRISANELLILVEGVDSTQQHKTTEQLQVILQRFEQSCGLMDPPICAMGAVSRTPQHQVQQILSESDHAMRQAQQSEQQLKWFAQLASQPLSIEQWRTMLNGDLRQHIELYRQPVLDWQSHKPVQWELFGRLNYEGNEYHAGQFLPYLNMINKGEAFDRALIETVTANEALTSSDQRLSINLTAAAVNNTSFRLWLIEHIKQTKTKLQFEVSELLAVDLSDDLLTLRQQLAAVHCPLGVDHFGRELASLDYLQKLAPDFVRLDHAFAGDTSEQTTQLCRALCLTAQGLQIDVYLAGVQEQRQLTPFEQFSLTGYQGFIQPPKRVNEAKPVALVTE
ncbi:LapD/MoxY N-terminal periplasmic domain-containing protein [Ferrimonas lipolytica]|uniref:EAL domain-containing protein n=1 Tax=Ferrimonas lipolytica TaxID=2724191 RepID=A0A6H1UG51_9GAMM|nr:LapD/MoxY N-terminal periplasmic domain-containing protein [Ferrimonas lipolytica]QIZ78024.1 EAL domain-containing protein [Ferrimonas lipolytica]